jgi:putative Holliday junction resolvase
MARVLAIDYGEKRVGIAVSDVTAIIASPLQVVAPEDLMSFLESYMSTEPVRAIIIGDPKTLDNKPGPLSAKVNRLKSSIEKQFPGVEVRLVDERFTSVMASKALIEAGYSKKSRQRKENVDKVSATILLQGYLGSRP